VLKLETLFGEVFEVTMVCLVDLLLSLVQSAHDSIHSFLIEIGFAH